ncbi:MAG: hypothetical protein PUI59_01905, partial [bacterium]|nr:hypothetical protein [bacterium]
MKDKEIKKHTKSTHFVHLLKKENFLFQKHLNKTKRRMKQQIKKRNSAFYVTAQIIFRVEIKNKG